MARTQQEIEQSIIDYKETRQELSVLDSLSNTAIWRAWVYISSLINRTIEVIFDKHRTEVENLIDEMKAHRPSWYKNMTLAFRYGQSLIPDTDRYDDTGLTPDIIEASKVVKYAAAKDGSTLIIKVAGETNGERSPLTADQEASLISYLEEIKDCGVDIELINEEPDYYRLTADIYYDPMILNSQGNRLDGSISQPVQSAIKNYIANLSFNGEYSNMALCDILQQIEGVKIPEIKLAETKYALYDWAPVNAKMTPHSGYMKVYDNADLILTWIPYAVSD
jgi:hypothetical protein